MALFQIIKLYLIIPKVIQTFLYVLTIQKLRKKYEGVKWHKRPQFYNLILIGMTGWLVYIFLDIFIFSFAGVSMNASTPVGLYKGYSTTYPSLFVANILRDLAFIGSLVMSWSYLGASFSLLFEREDVKKYYTHNILVYIILITVSAIITVEDSIKINRTEEGITVGAEFTGSPGISAIIDAIISFTISLLLFLILKRITKDDPSIVFRKRIRNCMLGIFVMGLGNIYWVVFGHLKTVNEELLNVLPDSAYFIIGQTIWSISAILIYFGFFDKKEKKRKYKI